MDYTMPRADNMPDLKLGFAGVPSPLNPLGVKGCGEAGAIASPAAIMNAVIDALSPLGVKDMDMPATPQRIWRAIHDAAA
jgi:aerobic carbon-monoxide dehydrogenase large subunit